MSSTQGRVLAAETAEQVRLHEDTNGAVQPSIASSPNTRRIRRSVGALAILLASGCASTPARDVARAVPSSTPKTSEEKALPEVLGLSLTVTDLDRSVAFFQGLDFMLDGRRELSGAPLAALEGLPSVMIRSARLHLGSEHVELDEFAERGRPLPDGAKSNDETFQHMAIVVADIDAAYQRLRNHGVETISPAPQTIPLSNPSAGGIRALYFHDPDRHALELIWFPTGKGNPRWQAPRTSAFLGIDHSALAVADTESEQRFYESFNFHVGGRSLNFGPEQEALSGVPGARVRITNLSPEKGPAVEFLSYLSPGPGRTMPQHTAPNDVWHWEVTVAVPDLDAALSGVESTGGHRVSTAPVDVTSLSLGYTRAALVTDLDGHCLRLVQR
jgi:catechol 2,3-dioxygenase-like lactoylglutathione lyase family enzyme